MFVYVLTVRQHTDTGEVIDNADRYYRQERHARNDANRMAGGNLVFYSENNSMFSAIIAADPELRHVSYRIAARRMED
jgi:hypothetical protein